jgi:hypothetical protein
VRVPLAKLEAGEALAALRPKLPKETLSSLVAALPRGEAAVLDGTRARVPLGTWVALPCARRAGAASAGGYVEAPFVGCVLAYNAYTGLYYVSCGWAALWSALVGALELRPRAPIDEHRREALLAEAAEAPFTLPPLPRAGGGGGGDGGGDGDDGGVDSDDEGGERLRETRFEAAVFLREAPVLLLPLGTRFVALEGGAFLADERSASLRPAKQLKVSKLAGVVEVELLSGGARPAPHLRRVVPLSALALSPRGIVKFATHGSAELDDARTWPRAPPPDRESEKESAWAYPEVSTDPLHVGSWALARLPLGGYFIGQVAMCGGGGGASGYSLTAPTKLQAFPDTVEGLPREALFPLLHNKPESPAAVAERVPSHLLLPPPGDVVTRARLGGNLGPLPPAGRETGLPLEGGSGAQNTLFWPLGRGHTLLPGKPPIGSPVLGWRSLRADFSVAHVREARTGGGFVATFERHVSDSLLDDLRPASARDKLLEFEAQCLPDAWWVPPPPAPTPPKTTTTATPGGAKGKAPAKPPGDGPPPLLPAPRRLRASAARRAPAGRRFLASAARRAPTGRLGLRGRPRRWRRRRRTRRRPGADNPHHLLGAPPGGDLKEGQR